ncbi:TetR/AcrR family transcriptional regulator [Phenylobacterium sp.]|uniref:TetR/AcrR family transcriptional regulator n=1 Tax=Phenylobacterium sp. TaxID=1871053 RepID=UPI002FDFD452
MSDPKIDAWALPAHQTRSRDQRDRLLRAGERVFAQKGFWEAHVTDIAKAADCSVGSFYRRFKDKEALFFALQEYMHERAHENIQRFFDDPGCLQEPFPDLFERLMGNTIRAIRGIAGYYRALYEMSLRGHAVWPKMRELEEYQGARIAELALRRGVSRARPDLAMAAQFITRVVNGQIISVILYGAGPFAFDDPRFRRELARLCVDYLDLRDTPPAPE